MKIIKGSDNCSKCGLCFLGNKKNNCTITVNANTDACKGDMVKINYSEGRGILIAFLLFLLPILIFILLIKLSINAGYSEILSFLMGIAGLLLYFFIIKDKNLRGIEITKE